MTTVRVYGDKECPACIKGLEYLKEKNIKYRLVAALDHPEELIKITGEEHIAIPVLCVGDRCVVGFNKDAWDKALKKK
jgi:glutaredoxin